MNKLLVVVLQTVVFAVKTLQEVYLAHALEIHFGITVIKINHLGCGVGGILTSDRRAQWVWSVCPYKNYSLQCFLTPQTLIFSN